MRILLTEDFTELNIPDELAVLDIEFEDLGVEVEEDGVVYTNTSGPMNDYGDTGEMDVTYHGTIDRWTWYDYEPTEQDFAEYLKVSADKLTDDMLADIDVEDFISFLATKYEEDAIKDARENYDSDDVNWEEDSDYYDYYDESLEEGKKRKKKSYSSMTYTTGNIGLNINHFNKVNGTDFDEKDKTADDAAEEATDAVTGGTSTGESVGGEAGVGGEAAGGAMGESMDKLQLTEDKIYVSKLGKYVDIPNHIKVLPMKQIGDLITQISPEEKFIVGYVTPLYFYKDLLDKFTLVKCTQYTGYTGIDYRETVDEDELLYSKEKTDRIARANQQISTGKISDHNRGNVNYDSINKTVKQAKLGSETIDVNDPNYNELHVTDTSKTYKNGRVDQSATVAGLKTILFYPAPGSYPLVKYFIDIHDGRGFWEVGRNVLEQTIFARLEAIANSAEGKEVVGGGRWDKDTLADKIRKQLESDAASVGGEVFTKGAQQFDDERKMQVTRPQVRALYTNQIYYMSCRAGTVGTRLLEAVNENLTEAKRYVRRYYIRPQNIFCSNKADIIKALIDIGDANCSVYTLNNLGDEKDVSKLMNKDIIYYYDDGILYDKNHVKVMDYDLYIKHEEERDNINVDNVSDATMQDVYDDRMTEVTELEEAFCLDFEDRNVFGEAVNHEYDCCICGEHFTGFGNNPAPYKEEGKCCDACNQKFVIPARMEEYTKNYNLD